MQVGEGQGTGDDGLNDHGVYTGQLGVHRLVSFRFRAWEG
jgi:hypothetical protein